MKKYLFEIGRRRVVNIIGKIKKNLKKVECEYKNTVSKNDNDKFTYEEYILRSRLSVFKYREDI